VDAKALYIVSGDKDLLDLGSFAGVEIVTAAEFCERYL
jgi:predicted nucleic acid-binding protein